ncbi:MAG: hypothetical protein ABIQ65_20750 [Thermoanaerobaculia bacterium]
MKTAVAIAAMLLISLSSSSPVRACSICRCGDPTFNALGTDVYTAGRFRLALDWDRFDKENGVASSGGSIRSRRILDSSLAGGDRELENRFTATLSYSFGENVNAVVRLPWSLRRLTSTDPDLGQSVTTRTNDLSDPEIYALIRVWSAEFSPGLGRRSWLSLIGGVRTSWGRNSLSEGGTRLDEHAQAGTCATDIFAGISAVYLLDPSSSLFSSAQYRRTGTNDFGYRYGNVSLANVAYERKLGTVVDGVVELNYRHAQQDQVDEDGSTDTNTGGDILYLTPRVILNFGGGLLGRISVQVPLLRSLYGDQTERLVVNAGLTILF